MRLRWVAAGFVMALGGVLVLAALGGFGTVHADANTFVLVLGGMLLAAGAILRPRRG